jgi:hypothetical protein
MLNKIQNPVMPVPLTNEEIAAQRKPIRDLIKTGKSKS